MENCQKKQEKLINARVKLTSKFEPLSKNPGSALANHAIIWLNFNRHIFQEKERHSLCKGTNHAINWHNFDLNIVSRKGDKVTYQHKVCQGTNPVIIWYHFF